MWYVDKWYTLDLAEGMADHIRSLPGVQRCYLVRQVGVEILAFAVIYYSTQEHFESHGRL